MEKEKTSVDSDRFEGMTTNERLFVAGILDAWNHAGRAKDRKKMIELLMAVDFTEADAKEIVSTVLANPEKYGL